MDQVGLGRSSPAGWICLLAALAALFKTAQTLWATNAWGKGAAAVPALFFLLISQAIVRDVMRGKRTESAASS